MFRSFPAVVEVSVWTSGSASYRKELLLYLQSKICELQRSSLDFRSLFADREREAMRTIRDLWIEGRNTLLASNFLNAVSRVLCVLQIYCVFAAVWTYQTFEAAIAVLLISDVVIYEAQSLIFMAVLSISRGILDKTLNLILRDNVETKVLQVKFSGYMRLLQDIQEISKIALHDDEENDCGESIEFVDFDELIVSIDKYLKGEVPKENFFFQLKAFHKQCKQYHEMLDSFRHTLDCNDVKFRVKEIKYKLLKALKNKRNSGILFFLHSIDEILWKKKEAMYDPLLPLQKPFVHVPADQILTKSEDEFKVLIEGWILENIEKIAFRLSEMRNKITVEFTMENICLGSAKIF